MHLHQLFIETLKKAVELKGFAHGKLGIFHDELNVEPIEALQLAAQVADANGREEGKGQSRRYLEHMQRVVFITCKAPEAATFSYPRGRAHLLMCRAGRVDRGGEAFQAPDESLYEFGTLFKGGECLF